MANKKRKSRPLAGAEVEKAACYSIEPLLLAVLAHGPGLMTLVSANLVILVGILTLLYLLCRRAWGVLAALPPAQLLSASLVARS